MTQVTQKKSRALLSLPKAISALNSGLELASAPAAWLKRPHLHYMYALVCQTFLDPCRNPCECERIYGSDGPNRAIGPGPGPDLALIWFISDTQHGGLSPGRCGMCALVSCFPGQCHARADGVRWVWRQL